jgi:hypothetical protein
VSESILVEIAEAMTDYETRRGRRPTHLYIYGPIVKELTKIQVTYDLHTVLGMRVVILSEAPMNAKGRKFFVTT